VPVVVGRPGLSAFGPDLSPCVLGRPMVGTTSSGALEWLDGPDPCVRYLVRRIPHNDDGLCSYTPGTESNLVVRITAGIR
jgi:hypothetical protein